MEARIHSVPALLTICVGLVACAPTTKVSVSANADSTYSHVFLTASEIWFNESASAAPADTTWVKYPLASPVTVDLASDSSDSIVELATALNLNPGTYAQVRLLPLDTSSTLTPSASHAGAIYNSEADFVDSTGTTQRVPLELLNPDQGIGLVGTLKIPRGSVSGDTSSSSPTFSLGLAFDAKRDLVMLSDGSGVRVLLNPHGSAYDLSRAGAILGTVNATALSGVSVTAETVSADGTRHVPVSGVPVRPDGSFTLYPLSTDPVTPTNYDLVIQGPALATVILRGVPVAAGSPSAATTTNVGSIAARDSTAYAVNLAPGADAMLPAGAVVRFHQTLPGSGEVPYSIAEASVDPGTRALTADLQLADSTIDVGTFVSTGAAIALAAQTPTDGAGVYRVAGSAPLYADGPLTTTVAGASGSSRAVIDVAVPSLRVASGATAATITATVSRSPFDAVDRGELLLTRDGAIIDAMPIDAALQQGAGARLTLTNLPGGSPSAAFDSGLYYIAVRAWNSASPANTLRQASFFTPLDLRNSSSGEIAISIN